MVKSTTLLITALLLTSFLPVAAQTSNSAARKFDEFPDIQASELVARLDNLAIALQNEPNARCFVIVYRSRRDLPGLSNRYAHRIKNYMVSSRGIDPERVITVDGGAAPCLSQELWIVPIGSAPQPRTDVYLNSYEPSIYKFDEHYYALSSDRLETSYWAAAPDNLIGYLESFAETLKKSPRAVAYLVAYRSIHGDNLNVTRHMLSNEKDFLVTEFGIKSSRVKTVSAGFRESRTMELWISRNGDYAPVITSVRLERSRRR